MKLKTIEVQIDGKTVTVAVVDEKGLPVYIHDDGKEVGHDAAHTVATITRLNGEARGHREAKEQAEERLKAFAGIEDPAAALQALDTVKNLKDGDLVQAGKVQEIKDAAKKAAEEQVAAAVKAEQERAKAIETERDTYRTQLEAALIGGSFSNSKFVEDKVAVPRHMLEKTYGSHFKVEDGKVVPYDAAGAKIFSRANPGEVATFDEAIEQIINADPHKDHILKGTGNSGGGANPNGGGNPGAKTYSRADFDKLEPTQRASVAKEVREGKATISD